MSTRSLPGIHRRAVAALPMYDLPQLKAATDTFWSAVAERLKNGGLRNVPPTLNRTDDYISTWSNSNLLLGQTCGFPMIKRFRNRVQIVATPIYEASGCEGAKHRSLFIVNAKSKCQALSDLRGAVCAVNGFDSNTGMNLLRAAVAHLAQGEPFFQSIVVTGSHYNSLKAVAGGRADLAAIDCVSFAHLNHFEPELTGRVKDIGQSVLTAAPPFITSIETDVKALALLRDALSDVAVDPKLESARSALSIGGFVYEMEADYEHILRIEKESAELGYPELC